MDNLIDIITGEGAMGLSPFAIDILQKGRPTLDELLFGCVMIFILNYIVIRYLMKKDLPMWIHIVINLINASFFLINNFVHLYWNNLWLPIIWFWTLVFFTLYYVLMFWEKGRPFWKNLDWIPSIIMGLQYTFGIIAWEGIWRVFFWGQDMSLLVTHAFDGVFYGQFLIYSIGCAAVATVIKRLIDKKRGQTAVKAGV